MANVMANATNFPRRINNYVPAMQYSSDVNYNGETRVNFGAPTATNFAAIASGISINAAGQADLSTAPTQNAPYGRTISVTASGAATSLVTVYGWDYLGQPMAEQFTLNGASTVQGFKCFKSFNYVTFGATAGTTINIGNGTRLGLPYVAYRVVYEISNGQITTVGTLQAPTGIDPVALTSTDPRGSYTPGASLSGSNVITAAFNMANDVNTAGHGGLHGFQHTVA
jgi:hypothetical protein